MIWFVGILLALYGKWCMQYGSNSTTCAHNVSRRRRKRKTQVRPASEPIEKVEIEILGMLIYTLKVNQYNTVIIDRYTEPTKFTKVKKATAIHVDCMFFELWTEVFTIPIYVLTDNGDKGLGKLLAILCIVVRLNYLTTTTFHIQRYPLKRQRYSSVATIASRLYYNVTEIKKTGTGMCSHWLTCTKQKRTSLLEGHFSTFYYVGRNQDQIWWADPVH